MNNTHIKVTRDIKNLKNDKQWEGRSSRTWKNVYKNKKDTIKKIQTVDLFYLHIYKTI